MESLGCIINKNLSNSREIRSTRPGGDSPSSLQVFLDTLKVNCYTDRLPKYSDIITVVQHYKNISFAEAIYYICEICGYDYYAKSEYALKETDPCLVFLDLIEPKEYIKDEVPLRKIDESLLSMYINLPNKLFLDEGITWETQRLFEIGYSVRDNCITIPIRDDLGNLVGVKGRTTLDYKKLNIPKYWFPIPTPKSQILYGLHKTYEFIKKEKRVYVFEGEKSVLKAWSWGIKNTVSIGGHELSEAQIIKLERLGVEIVIAYDSNIGKSDILKEAKKFMVRDNLFALYPYKNKNVLGEKDAPVDLGYNFFQKLINEDIYKLPA